MHHLDQAALSPFGAGTVTQGYGFGSADPKKLGPVFPGIEIDHGPELVIQLLQLIKRFADPLDLSGEGGQLLFLLFVLLVEMCEPGDLPLDCDIVEDNGCEEDGSGKGEKRKKHQKEF